MSFLNKMIGFIAVSAVVPAAIAATARPSVITSAAARLPTMTASISGGTSSSGSNNNSTTTTLATNECVEAYTSCLQASDVCGANFEECTNKTLFFSKKGFCASTLMQCNTAGITNLYGSATQTAFANKNSSGEYTYPTDGSTLGQMIEAAHITNRYDTSQCVRRYTTCLKKDDVCGADFELCTSNTEFKKQKLFCESTLARCQNEGLTELFGTTNTASNPTGSSRLGIMISEGAALAAVNAVATCYKVADQCILNTCAQNPYKCKEGSNQEIVKIVETINSTDGTTTTTETENILGAVNRNEISGFIRNSCQDTIGGNKFCYATFIGNGAMPTNSQLMDEDNRGEIYAEAYSSRMNDSMRSKIDDLIEKFEKKTKQRCQDTITSCAMRTCGEGSGSACYASAFNTQNSIKGVTNPSTMADIKYGCEAVVNSDTSCKYSAATFQTTTGVLSFLDTTLFDTLFTSPDDTSASKPDPVGAVAALNAKLSLSYNQAALDQMQRQCQTVATGCVKTMCGADYTNCYRNRTDVYSSLTKTDNDTFNKSMNKVGGVLDYTVVLGLCLNTVKTNPVCDEHIKAEAARTKAGKTNTSIGWGENISTARDGWLGAGVYSATGSTTEYQDMDADSNLLCTTQKDNGGQIARCDDVSGLYIYPYMISESAYNIAQAERTIFRDLVYDLEKEAQAIYNAKLTKQQNMCLQGNNGGIVGTKDLGGVFQWVKLRNNKVPANYVTKGLSTTQFVSSNELYGSFCRIRVTLQSDDKKIQDAISAGKDWGTAYFAAGDTFTCGSWIPEKALTDISNEVAKQKSGTNADGSLKSGQKWAVIGTSLLGAIGGGIGMNELQNGKLGGLLGTVKQVDTPRAKNLRECITKVDDSMRGITDTSLNYELTEELIGTGADAVTCRIYKAASVTAPFAGTNTAKTTCAADQYFSIKSRGCTPCPSNAHCYGSISNPTCKKTVDETWDVYKETCVKKDTTSNLLNTAGTLVGGTQDTYILNKSTKPTPSTTQPTAAPAVNPELCPATGNKTSIVDSKKIGDGCTSTYIKSGTVIWTGEDKKSCTCKATECNTVNGTEYEVKNGACAKKNTTPTDSTEKKTRTQDITFI